MKKYRMAAEAGQKERLANLTADKLMEHPKSIKNYSKPQLKTGGKAEHERKADGHKPKARLDRYARGGKVKDKGRTTVNVIVAPGGDKGAQAMPMPMPPPGAAPPPPMPPPRPPIPVAPVGGAPMPPGAMAPMMGRKRGGRVDHPDAAEDKKLIRKMVKPEDLKRAKGGAVGKFTAGALSGEGRLQKTAHAKARGL